MAPKLEIAERLWYRGPCTLREISSAETSFASSEWVVTLDKTAGQYAGHTYQLRDVDPSALVRLSESCDPDDLPANISWEREMALLGSYIAPSVKVRASVAEFVQDHGLLMNEPGRTPPIGHDCNPYLYRHCDLFISVADRDGLPKGKALASPDQPYPGRSRYSALQIQLSSDEDFEYVNALPWLLNEALAFREAYELWEALALYRGTRDAARAADLITSRLSREARDELLEFRRVPTRQRNAYWIGFGYRQLEGAMNDHLELARMGMKFAEPTSDIAPLELDRLRLATVGAVPMPQSLLGAYWLKLYLMAYEGEGIHICLQCNERFKPERSDAQFCSPEHGATYRRMHSDRQR